MNITVKYENGKLIYDFKGKTNEVEITEKLARELGLIEKRWIPDTREFYYYIDEYGYVSSGYWKNSEAYKHQIAYTNNYYRTAAEVCDAQKRLEYSTKYSNYLLERSMKIDWEDKEQKKWYAFYDYQTKNIEINYCLTYKIQGVLYASSEEIIKDFIKEIGEDNFINYVL